MSTEKWDRRFIKIAQEVAGWSKDPGSHVGAVLVADRRIISTGYNGLPAGMVDDDRVLDREFKLRHTIHAEVNAVLNASRHGMSTLGTTLYVVGLPVCPDCAKVVVQAGVRRIVMAYPDRPESEWMKAHSHSSKLFSEVGVEVERIDLY